MGKIKAVFVAYLRIFFKKKWLVAFSIGFPVIFFIFFSLIFTNYDDVNKIPIGLINEDQSEMSSRIIEKLKENKALKVISESESEAEKLLKNNRIEAIFVFKTGFEKAIQTSKFDDSIQLIYLDKSTIGPTLGDIIASEVITDLAIYKSANTANLYEKKYNLEGLFDKITHNGKSFVENNHFEMSVNSIVRSPQSLLDENLNIQKILKINITFGFTLVIFSYVIFFAHTHLIDTKTYMMKRYLPAGFSPLILYLGELSSIMISTLCIAFIQLIIFVVGFKFHDGSQISIMMITLLLHGGFIVNMVLLLTLLIKNKTKYQSLIAPSVFFLGLIGGAFWSTEFLSSNLKWISYGSPFYWSLKMLNGVFLNTPIPYLKIIFGYASVNVVLSLATISLYQFYYYRLRKGTVKGL
ncbi:MAG: ABC transporter permease [Clostridia bacterium]|nr:ABC transporter permease [Clostridia bacterium]